MPSDNSPGGSAFSAEAAVDPEIRPWMRGPYELIRHAYGHLKNADDTDRRVALIGFDNAIEVCIDVFLKLHPMQRSGLQIPREEVEKATRNYHTKIAFLDEHAQSRKVTIAVPVEVIVWYHQLRNELYHSGNGMVPEVHVLYGAFDAAAAVFKALFGVDVLPKLGMTKEPTRRDPIAVPQMTNNSRMELFRWFIELEKALVEKLHSGSRPQGTTRAPLRQLWREYRRTRQVPEAWDRTISRAVEIRNQIAHGGDRHLDEDEILSTMCELEEIANRVSGSTGD